MAGIGFLDASMLRARIALAMDLCMSGVGAFIFREILEGSRNRASE
jgi:hypothetical protein